jgi:glutamate/aspartate transport system permease protein
MTSILGWLDFTIFLQPAFDGSGNYLRFLLIGLQWTVLLGVCSFLLAFVVGSVIGILRTLPGALPQRIGAAYVELFRNVPLLVQLFIWYFVLPDVVPFFGEWFKQSLDPLLQQFVAGLLCLGLFTGARVAEQVRSGINALPPGQRGAGLALGLRLNEVYGLVLLPVAYRILVPTLTSEFLNNMKNTSVVSTIGFIELARQSQQLSEFTAHPYEALTAATLLYAIINLAVMIVSRFVERLTQLPGFLGGKN